MFFKSQEPGVTPAPQPQAVKRLARSTVPSIISADLTVKGTLVSAGDLQIEGHIEGDIRAGALVIGEKASIEGDLFAEEATIRGHVHGNVRAHKVQLCTSGRVEGNILHEALSMEAGAHFEGNCRHSDDPLAEGADAAPQRKTQSEVFEHRPAASASPLRPANVPQATPRVAPSVAPRASFTPLKS
jgi:cytoskeletal protein CcmA (bactofilin family)